MAQYPQETMFRLLDLQTEDSAIARLEAKKAALPEALRLQEVKDQLAELDADLAIATKQHDEIAREQDRVEGEIEILTQKIAREESRMYSGSVANPKELSALQAEVASLKKQQATREDELLEVMLQKDAAAGTLETLKREQAESSQEAADLGSKVAVLAGDMDSELAQHIDTRAQILPDIPADLLTLYERLRSQRDGVGAAPLEGGTCQGCHTKLPAALVEGMKAEKGLQRCDNCRRILVVK